MLKRIPPLLLILALHLYAHSQDFATIAIEGTTQSINLEDTAAIQEVYQSIIGLSVDNDQKAVYLLHLGQELVSRFKYDLADTVLNKCLELTDKQETQAAAFFQLGISAMYRDLRLQSLTQFRQALAAYQNLGDSLGMGRSLDRIADNHNYLGEHSIARPIYDEALVIFSAIGDTAALTNVLGNIGGMLNEDALHDSSIFFYQQSIAINEAGNNLSNLTHDYAGIAMAYRDMNNMDSAFYFYQKGYQSAYKGGDQIDRAFANQHMGYFHFYNENYDSAIYYMTSTYQFAKALSNSQLLTNAMDVLHQSYYATRIYKTAYDIYEEVTTLRDSLLSLENVSLISTIRREYDIEIQEAANEALMEQAAIREEYINRQSTLITLLLLFAILLAIAMIVLVLLNRNRKKKNLIISQDRDLIKQQSERLKEMDQLKSTFFANVAHDFRAPITLLIGFADLIKINQPDLTEESREYIQQIHETAHRLTAMSGEINQLIQLEHSQYQLKKESIDVNELFGTIGKMYQLGRKQTEINFSYESTVPEATMIHADRAALEKIIFNLTGNAFKYNTTGKEVSLRLSQEGQSIQMIVCDDGPGIQPEKIDKIFERYYRTEKGSEAATGLGIGLSLVKDLVELHGGEVSVTSVPEEKTCFKVQLPL